MTRVLVRQHRRLIIVVLIWLAALAVAVAGAVASRFPTSGFSDWSLGLLPPLAGVLSATLVVPPEVRSGRSDMLWNHVDPRRWFTWQVAGFLVLAAVVGMVAWTLSYAYYTIDPYHNGLFPDPGPMFAHAYDYPRWGIFATTGPVIAARTVAAASLGLAVGAIARNAITAGVFVGLVVPIALTAEGIARPLLHPPVTTTAPPGTGFPLSQSDWWLSVNYTGSHAVGTYHPISQFWSMQLTETAFLLVAAALFVALSVWSFRRFTS